MKVEQIYVTPEIAATMLAKNTDNRKHNPITTKRYAAEMTTGLWSETGETIKLSKNTLLDGQHRLAAIIKSGTSHNMIVVSDLPKDAFKDIDTGRKRSFSDVLYIDGYKNTQLLASATKYIHAYKTKGITGIMDGQNMVYNHKTLHDALQNDDRILDSSEFAQTAPKNAMLTKPAIAVLHYILGSKDQVSTDGFLYKVMTGEEIKAGSPILRLRDKVNMVKTNGGRLSTSSLIHLTIQAWNACRTGKKADIAFSTRVTEIL